MSMGNLSKRDVNLLLVVLGLAIVLATYFLVYSNFTRQTETLNTEIVNLRPRLIQLQEHEANIPIYDLGIVDATTRINEEKQTYVQEIRTEDLIMYAVMLEDEMGISISSASFTPPTLISEFTAPNENGDPAYYSAYKVSMTLNAKFGYEPLKDAINRIYETVDKTMLDDVSITFDVETGGLLGNITISKVFVTDGTYVYEPTQVPVGASGTVNPFATITMPTEGDEPPSE